MMTNQTNTSVHTTSRNEQTCLCANYPSGFWFLDLSTNTYQFVNRQFWEILGYKLDEVSPEVANSVIVHEDDALLVSEALKKLCSNSDSFYDVEYRCRHQNGSVVWINTRGYAERNEDGFAIRMHASHKDITKEKEVFSIEQSNVNLLKSMISCFKDVLIFSIDEQYRYLLFNEAFRNATFLAYGTRVETGMSMLESITDAEDREKARKNCDLAFAGNSHMTTEVYGDKEKHFFETRYNPAFVENGIAKSVTVMSSNVTERKLAEEQLHALNKELDSFSYSVSHDLRAPLRAINGHASILTEDFSGILNKDAQMTVDAIWKNSRKMGHLIDDLLTFSHLGKKNIHKSEIHMTNLVQQVIEDVCEQFETSPTIFDLAEIQNAHGDKSLIRQVWVNLISNAVKYSLKNQEVRIRICSRIESQEIVYEIQDNGAGFDMKYYDKLFGVFQRLHHDTEFEGTGVGLAIVQRILNRHNGRIWADSQLEKGATFFFTLPLPETLNQK